MGMKQIMISLKPKHAEIFIEEAQKIGLPTSSFIRTIILQWLSDTGKLANMGHIETQIVPLPKQDDEAKEYKI